MKPLTYKSAGVDTKKADRFVERIKPIIGTSGGNKGIGGFGGFFKFDIKKYKDPVFVSSADGVGTKLRLAFLINKHNTVGIDLVAMNVNDVVCTGARPLFFLDYISTGKIQTNVLVDVLKGIVDGCKQAGCALVGGETAEMPSFYKPGEYDLAGFSIGVAESKKVTTGSDTKVGDVIIGLESNGLHSNGYSLARRVFSKSELRTLAKELLKPTRIYVKPILSLLEIKDKRQQAAIRGIAHITGGAFYGKIPRIIPAKKAFKIYKDSWPVPKIFKLIQKKGHINEKEMYSCFNMGVGMVLTVAKDRAQTVINGLERFKLRSWIIGDVIQGNGEVEVV